MKIRLVCIIIFVSVCISIDSRGARSAPLVRTVYTIYGISILAHVYINSYIHELLIVLMLTEKASWF